MALYKPNCWSLACWNSTWTSCIRTSTCFTILNRCKSGSVRPCGMHYRSLKRLQHVSRISILVLQYSITRRRMSQSAVFRLHSKHMACKFLSPTSSTNQWFGTIFFATIWLKISTGKSFQKSSTCITRRRNTMRIINNFTHVHAAAKDNDNSLKTPLIATQTKFKIEI